VTEDAQDTRLPHVVVVGGGFAGMAAVKALADAPVRITLIDRRVYNTFQPLLYQIATGGLNPGDVTYFLRALHLRQRNVRVLHEHVAQINTDTRCVGLPDDPVPTLMYGYGGFNVAIGASFSSIDTGWLTAGGAVAIANLRGGGEFGTEWYEQGTRAAKQNVFDDFAALGEHLIATGVTTSPQLAAYGASNGGLLIGALITQHPGLVAAAVPMVGVLDLLRFHRFTIGAAWISDYGDPDVAEDFEVALAYSPLHHIREGETYPATLVVTGDHDDRVVPAHSHKFTATLQRAQGGEAPILTRVETSTGHGAGKPRAVAAQEAPDVLAFLAHHTGLVLRAH